MPALLQSLHGYTALTAGLAMLPAGLAAAVGMVAVGVLTKRVQLRYLVAIGLISQILPYWHMSGFATDLTFWHVAWAMVPQFLGLGCLAIPLLSLCYDGLSPTQTNGASTLITISRFIGGSFGISLVTTWLSWRTQYHHSILAEHISPYDPSVMDTLAGVQAALPPSGAADPSADPQTALALDGLVNRQAGVMAYNDVFILMLLVCLTVLPLVFFLPRNKPGQGNVAIH
jgi:DHA2 family multidrug resistance protein